MAQNALPNSGNIGVGLLNPTKAIQIGDYGYGNDNSQILIPGVYNFEKVRLGQLGNGNSTLEFVNHTGIGSSYGVRLLANIDSGGQGLQFQYAATKGAYEELNYQTGMFLTTNGRVGIGTLGPESIFHVQSDANTSGAPQNSQLLVSGTTNPGKRLSIAYNTSSNYAEMQSQAYSGTYTPILLNPNGGDIGIGTTDPKGYKLAVNGNIRAKEIKVENTNWPDYVFTKDYQLPTLQQTENHIKEKGYLPGIPSAEEVKANGIDLGEMNAKLLQKIEELTLYLIEQNKKMDGVQKENESMKERILNLEKKI